MITGFTETSERKEMVKPEVYTIGQPKKKFLVHQKEHGVKLHSAPDTKLAVLTGKVS